MCGEEMGVIIESLSLSSRFPVGIAKPGSLTLTVLAVSRELKAGLTSILSSSIILSLDRRFRKVIYANAPKTLTTTVKGVLD
jgi:hypothetical protein